MIFITSLWTSSLPASVEGDNKVNFILENMISNAVLAYKVLVIVPRVGEICAWSSSKSRFLGQAWDNHHSAAKAVIEITQQLPRNTRKTSSGGQIWAQGETRKWLISSPERHIMTKKTLTIWQYVPIRTKQHIDKEHFSTRPVRRPVQRSVRRPETQKSRSSFDLVIDRVFLPSLSGSSVLSHRFLAFVIYHQRKKASIRSARASWSLNHVFPNLTWLSQNIQDALI